MKGTLVLALTMLLMLAAAAAGTTTTEQWSLGWDNFGEPLNLAKSNVKWSVSTSRKLTVTFSLVGARPSKEYQVSINFFCSTFPATLGQFPTDGGGGACQALTRQGVTKDSAGRTRCGVDRHPRQRVVHGRDQSCSVRYLRS